MRRNPGRWRVSPSNSQRHARAYKQLLACQWPTGARDVEPAADVEPSLTPRHVEMQSITVSSSWIRFCRVSRSASPPHVHAHGDAGLADCTAVLLPHSACIISCRLDVAPSLRHARGSSCAIASSSSCAGCPVPGSTRIDAAAQL